MNIEPSSHVRRCLLRETFALLISLPISFQYHSLLSTTVSLQLKVVSLSGAHSSFSSLWQLTSRCPFVLIFYLAARCTRLFTYTPTIPECLFVSLLSTTTTTYAVSCELSIRKSLWRADYENVPHQYLCFI